jgi:hypothetical protein
MPRHSRRPCTKSTLSLLLLFLVSSAASAQTTSSPLEPGAPGSNALPYLTELFARYAHATSYHLEYVEEHKMDGEFSRSWNKTVITSIVGPEEQYRFERHGSSAPVCKSPTARPNGFISSL